MPAPEKRIRNGRARWYARYYDPSGQRHSKAFDTRAEADRFLATVGHSEDHRCICRPEPLAVDGGRLGRAVADVQVGYRTQDSRPI